MQTRSSWRRAFRFESVLPPKQHPLPLLTKKPFEIFGKKNGRKPLKMPPKGCRTPRTNIAPNERPREPFVFACAPPTKRCRSRIASAKGASEENFDDFRQKCPKKSSQKPCFCCSQELLQMADLPPQYCSLFAFGQAIVVATGRSAPPSIVRATYFVRIL